MITFKQIDKENIDILKDGKKVGHIFSPSGSGKDNVNCIQVCGFSELFDFWGCGVREGFKDVQMYFGDNAMPGKHDVTSPDTCYRCYKKPCCCEEAFKIKRHKDIIAERI